jgi:SAM-dependent methyltransferase
MLEYHLSQETDLASRRLSSIEQVVDWIDAELDLPGKRLCDLGCGPGLYTRRFGLKGAKVTGVDISAVSLDHAQREDTNTTYFKADYLSDDLPGGFDVITLIYTDYCVLSPIQRKKLLGRMHEMLNPDGQIVLDVAGMGSFAGKEEITLIEDRLMNGFWAPGKYIGIQRTFLYASQQLALDYYVIVEPDETWQIYNWFQHFTPESIESELQDSGFEVDQMLGDLSGAPLEAGSELLGIIARST